jgi:hypothetical protein
MSRFEQFIQERIYLQNVSPRTIDWYHQVFKWLEKYPLTEQGLNRAASGLETVESRTITVRINRPFDRVYEFLANPANWNQWAFGLGKNIRRSNDGWIADSDGASRRCAPRQIALAWWITPSCALRASVCVCPCD